MVLNLAAIAVTLLALTTAVVLLRRRLRVSPSVASVTCLACGQPAAAMASDSFICPGCQNDVRQRGLGARRGAQSPVVPMFCATVVIVVLALISTAGVLSGLQSAEVVTTRSLSPADDRSAIRSIELGARVTRFGGDGGELVADVLFRDGDVRRLIVESASQRARIIDIDGRLAGEGSFGDAMLRQWISHPALSELTIQKMSGALQTELSNALDPSKQSANSQEDLFSAGRSMQSQITFGPRWVAPAMLIAWSLIWLALMIYVLRVPMSARRVHNDGGQR